VFARIPVARMLRIAYLVMGVMLVGVGLLARGQWSLFGLYAVVGIATAMPVSIPGLWIASSVRTKTERPLTAVAASYAVATVIVPWLIGALLGGGAGWRWIPVAEGALALLLGLLPVDRYLPDIPHRQGLGLGQMRTMWRFRPGLLVMLIAGVAVYVGMESSFGVWFPKFHQSVLGAGVTSSALTVTLYWAGMLFGRLTIIRIFRRRGRSTLILVLSLATAGFVALIALSPAFWVSVPAIFCLGLATSAIWPLLTAYCSRFPSWYAGTVFTIAGLAGAGASALFPYAMGPAASGLGFRAAVMLLVIPAFAVAGVAMYLKRSAEGEAAATPERSPAPDPNRP
jgi:FHS family glucose/mannose:H+ symporter-like MFS transporter